MIRISAFVIVAIGLLAMYGASLRETYLFADETWLFADYMVDRSLLQAVAAYTVSFGRPLLALVHHAMSQAIHLGDAGLAALRVLQYLGSLLGAWLVLLLIVRLGLSWLQGTLLVLFIWSQPAFAITHLYAHVGAGWPFALLSLFAFWLVVDDRAPLRGRMAVVVAYGLFLLGFFGSQVATFFCAGFIALAALQDRSLTAWRRHIAVFGALCAAFTTYVLFYVAARYGLGYFTYRGGAPIGLSLEALRVFEFWNTPVRVPATTGQVLGACLAVAVAWVAVTVAACMRERTSPAVKGRRWGLAAACVASTFAVVIADGSSGRQHLFLASVPALVLVGGYALDVLMRGVHPRLRRAAALVAVFSVVAGASLSYPRDLVRPSASMFAFIERSLAADGDRTGNPGPVSVIVPAPAFWSDVCQEQPCGGFYGRRFQLHWHVTRSSYYATVLRLSDRPWRRSFEFVRPGETADLRPTVVDWPAFLREQACLGRLATQRYPCAD